MKSRWFCGCIGLIGLVVMLKAQDAQPGTLPATRVTLQLQEASPIAAYTALLSHLDLGHLVAEAATPPPPDTTISLQVTDMSFWEAWYTLTGQVPARLQFHQEGRYMDFDFQAGAGQENLVLIGGAICRLDYLGMDLHSRRTFGSDLLQRSHSPRGLSMRLSMLAEPGVVSHTIESRFTSVKTDTGEELADDGRLTRTTGLQIYCNFPAPTSRASTISIAGSHTLTYARLTGEHRITDLSRPDQAFEINGQRVLYKGLTSESTGYGQHCIVHFEFPADRPFPETMKDWQQVKPYVIVGDQTRPMIHPSISNADYTAGFRLNLSNEQEIDSIVIPTCSDAQVAVLPFQIADIPLPDMSALYGWAPDAAAREAELPLAQLTDYTYTLDLEDVPLNEALARLAEVTGADFQIHDPFQQGPGQRRVDLQAIDLSLWQILDQLVLYRVQSNGTIQILNEQPATLTAEHHPPVNYLGPVRYWVSEINLNGQASHYFNLPGNNQSPDPRLQIMANMAIDPSFPLTGVAFQISRLVIDGVNVIRSGHLQIEASSKYAPTINATTALDRPYRKPLVEEMELTCLLTSQEGVTHLRIDDLSKPMDLKTDDGVIGKYLGSQDNGLAFEVPGAPRNWQQNRLQAFTVDTDTPQTARGYRSAGDTSWVRYAETPDYLILTWPTGEKIYRESVIFHDIPLPPFFGAEAQ